MEFVEEVDVGRSRSVMCGRSVEFVCIEVDGEETHTTTCRVCV
jgi:hypothetical protein